MGMNATSTNKEHSMSKSAKASRNSRFQRGSGVYKCNGCGRSTRATGNGDNEHVKLCVECYELAGIENEISDGMATEEERAEEVAALKAAIVAKGGTL